MRIATIFVAVGAGYLIFLAMSVAWKVAVRCESQHPGFGRCILKPRHYTMHVNIRGQRWR